MISRILLSLLLGLAVAACPPAVDDDATDDDTGDDDVGDDDDAGDDDDGDDDDTDDGDDTADDDDGVDPPFGASSGGSGGGTCTSPCTESADGITYRMLTPGGYNDNQSTPLLLIYSGTEGGAGMMSNMQQVADYCGVGDALIAVLDGTTYYGDGDAGATALDDVRARWNVDNDRTYLLSESAGTSAGLELGFHLRQSYFAAYWANDVNAQDTPGQTAAQLGFQPWGNAGPGGDYPDANAIVAGMENNAYRLPADAPYSGTGAGTHGSTEQFLEAVAFFAGKSRP